MDLATRRKASGVANAGARLTPEHVLPRAGRGHQGVAGDVVFGALNAQRVGQAQQAQLGGAVVGLPKVAVHARRRRGHDDAPVLLLAHVRPGRAADEE